MIKKDCKKENKSSRVRFDPPIKPRYIPGQVTQQFLFQFQGFNFDVFSS